MTSPHIKGACPSLYAPMAAGDGLLLRVKPRAGGLSAAQLHQLADAGAAFGNGQVSLTNRGNFQLRGFTATSAVEFARAMQAAGLASASPATEQRRNLLVGVTSDDSVMLLARRLESWLEEDESLAALPAKFGFAVGVISAQADISILPGESAEIWLPGGVFCRTTDPLAAVKALTSAFLRLRAQATPQPSRMRACCAADGAARVLAAAGLVAQASATTRTLPEMTDGAALALPFGLQPVRMLEHAATLAARFGPGSLAINAARQLVLKTFGPAARHELEAAAAALGFITQATDPRLRITVCAGWPACPSGLVDSQALATVLAPHWRGPGILHVSGCAKGCAHPGAATTLVGTNAAERYDFIAHGTASAPTPHRGISIARVIQRLTEMAHT